MHLERDHEAPAQRRGDSLGMQGRTTHHAGKSEWLTPPAIVHAVGPFDLDPCAPIIRPWPTALEHFTIAHNGLLKPWHGRVWLNPPYGQETGKWLGRLAEHGNGVALIFARTETADWFTHVWPIAHGILFLKGRVDFYHVDGRKAKRDGGAPSALVAYGSRNAGCLCTCGLAGKFVELQ